MEDIFRKVVYVLRSDAPLAAMLGATAADSRITLYYRADALITPDLPAYVTVALTNEGGAQGAVATPTYTVAAWARSQDVLERVNGRIRYLLHKRIYTTSSNRRFYIKQVGAADRFQPQPNFSGRTLQFNAGWLEIADAVSVEVSESVGTGEG